MIDENKVRLMTKISIYEKKEKNRGLVISKFFKRDYVRYNVLKTFVAATIVYWIAVGAYAFVAFDSLLSEMNNMDYFGVMYKILGCYVAFCFIYMLIAYFIYSYRYNKSKDGLTEYNSNLKDLIELSGGPIHRARVVKNTDINPVRQVSEKTNAGVDNKKPLVNKTQMLNNKLKQEEEERQKQIIENAKLRQERLAERRKMEEERKIQIEAAKKQIRERRIALEEQQRKQSMKEYSDNIKKGEHK